MIGNFEGNKPSVKYPTSYFAKEIYSKITSIFLSLPDFEFTDEDDFKSESSWKEAISDGNLFPIQYVKESESTSEDTIYNTSELDYTYLITTGKIRFIFRFLYRYEFHQILSSYSGQYFKIFFSDINNKVIGVNDSTIKGFDTNLIEVQKLEFGTIAPSFTQIYVELADATELNNAIFSLVTWNASTIMHLIVTIDNFNDSTVYITTFTVTESQCGLLIDHLVASDFAITDSISGSISLSGLVNLGKGNYQVTSGKQFTSGSVAVSNDDYSGTGSYSFQSFIAVDIVNFTDPDVDEIRFKVQTDNRSNAISGIPESAFSINDNVKGAITFDTFTDLGSGNYAVTSSQEFYNGDVTVTGDYQGTGAYNFRVLIEVTLSAFNDPTVNKLEVTINETISGDPVTDLTQGYFSIIDDVTGSIVISAFTNDGGGDYTIDSLQEFYSGTLTITGDRYGSGDYSFRTKQFNPSQFNPSQFN